VLLVVTVGALTWFLFSSSSFIPSPSDALLLVVPWVVANLRSDSTIYNNIKLITLNLSYLLLSLLLLFLLFVALGVKPHVRGFIPGPQTQEAEQEKTTKQEAGLLTLPLLQDYKDKGVPGAYPATAHIQHGCVGCIGWWQRGLVVLCQRPDSSIVNVSHQPGRGVENSIG